MKKISSSQLQKNLSEVNNLFSIGNMEDAEKILCELLTTFPSHPEVLSKLGTIYLYQDKLNDGIQLIKKSLGVNPYQPDVLNNYAVALLNSNKAQEAIKIVKQAISLKPDYIDAHYHLGVIYKSLGLYDDALKAYQNTLQLLPSHENALINSAAIYIQLEKYEDAVSVLSDVKLANPSVNYFYNLGLAHLNLEHFNEAEQLFHHVINQNPDFSEAWNNLSLALKGLERFEDAIKFIEKAIALDNNYAEAHNNKGLILIKLERFDEALTQFQIALKLKPDDYEIYNNIGVAFKGLGKFEEALIDLNRAIQINPLFAKAYNNRGILFRDHRAYDNAIQDYMKAVELDPKFFEPKFNLSLIYLAKLNFKEGWIYYEKRKEVSEFLKKTKNLNKIYLDQIPESHKPILLCSEQGIGDQIIFLSLLHEVIKWINPILVRIDPRLIPLFKRSFPTINFYSDKENFDPSLYNYHALAGSLPKFFRGSTESFSNQKRSFLIADQDKISALRKQLTNKGRIVCGITWKSANEKIGHFKTASLDDYLPILKLPSINFVDLQYGDTLSERSDLKSSHGIMLTKIEDIDNFNDIDSLASLIGACDFIVTISNVTAHIAGALGKKVFLLLPYDKGKIWYWHDNLKVSLWYPSVEIFTQSETGDWKKPVSDIKEQLVKLIEHE